MYNPNQTDSSEGVGDNYGDACDACPAFLNSCNGAGCSAAGGNDANGDRVPTDCQCGDPNDDGLVDFQDVGCFGNCFVGGTLPPGCVCTGPKADANGDGVIDFQDVGLVAQVFVGTAPSSDLTCVARPLGGPVP